MFERKDIPILHNSLRPLVLFPAEKKKKKSINFKNFSRR